ncbi:MAG: hypothetical protein PGN34_21185 [Methylobacterium frigidaeris]
MNATPVNVSIPHASRSVPRTENGRAPHREPIARPVALPALAAALRAVRGLRTGETRYVRHPRRLHEDCVAD